MVEAKGVPELELVIRRRDADGVEVDALFRPVAGAESTLASAVQAILDAVALRAAENDTAVYGQLLARGLFASPELRRAWDQAHAIGTREGGLRLLLRLVDPGGELHALRWERLTSPGTARPLALDGGISLARVAETSDLRPAPPSPGPRSKALLAIAFPDDLALYGLAQFDAADEAALVCGAVGALRYSLLARGADRAEPERRATLHAIANALTSPHEIVFIQAHGTLSQGEAHLWLEQDGGDPDRVSADRLAGAIALATQRPSLVILACCLSAGNGNTAAGLALGPALVQAGVPSVIAMQGYLSPDQLGRFVPALFAGLQEPDASLDHAMTRARRALADDGGWWLPVLYTRVVGQRVVGPLTDPDDALVRATLARRQPGRRPNSIFRSARVTSCAAQAASIRPKTWQPMSFKRFKA